MKLAFRYIVVSLIVITFWGFSLLIVYPQTGKYYWQDETKSQLIGLDAMEEWKTFGENELIDKYEKNNYKFAGENGRGILLAGEEKEIGDEALKLYGINTKVSDLVPLNRKVPDSRPLP